MPDKFAVVDTTALLFVVSGMSARYYLQSHTTKQFVKDKTRKLLVPSTIGLFVFQWLLGMSGCLIPRVLFHFVFLHNKTTQCKPKESVLCCVVCFICMIVVGICLLAVQIISLTSFTQGGF